MRRLASAVLIVVVLAVPLAVAAEGEQRAPLVPEEAKLIELGRPGPDHAKLEPMIGSWEGEVLYWPYPGAGAVPSTATAERSWILGGRYVRTEFRSKVGDEPFEGLALLGFDRVAGTYRFTWLDTLSTQVLTLAGSCPDACRELVLEGERLDPQTGRTYRVRQVQRFLDEDQQTVEYYDELDDGTLFKSLEIRWRRK